VIYFFAFVIYGFIRRRRGKHGGVGAMDNRGARPAYELPPFQYPGGDEMKSPLIQPSARGNAAYELRNEPSLAGRYEPTRYDRHEQYGDDDVESYDPPPPIFNSAPTRPMSPGRSRQDLHLGE